MILELLGLLSIVLISLGRLLLYAILMLVWMSTKPWDLLGWLLLFIDKHHIILFLISGIMIVVGIILGIVEKRAGSKIDSK